MIDLSVIDACALLDGAAVQRLTGIPDEFIADGAPPFPSNISCFWAVPKPGYPQYVELQIFKRSSIDGYQFQSNNVVCTTDPISAAGIEAVGGTCSTPQQKVYVVVSEDGVALSLLVNEPTNALTPTELLSTAKPLIEAALAP